MQGVRSGQSNGGLSGPFGPPYAGHLAPTVTAGLGQGSSGVQRVELGVRDGLLVGVEADVAEQ